MTNREGEILSIEEYDGYIIPQSDPNISEEEKRRIIAEAEAELKDLIGKAKKHKQML